MKNREKLSEMSNEELANFIFNVEGMCSICVNSKYSEECHIYFCKDTNKD